MKIPDYISNSQLNAFRKSPAHWVHYVTEKKAPTEAMIKGSLAHALALKQPLDRFYFLDVKERPEPNKTFASNLNKAWLKQIEEQCAELKQEIVYPETLDECTKMVESLYRDKIAVRYLEGQFEAKLEWMSMGLKFMGIRDISSDTFIADLKFVQSADPRDFRRYLFREGLYRQGGMYLDGEMGGQMTGDPHKKVLFIAVENSAPYGVSVHELQQEVIDYGVNEYRRLAEQLHDCIEADHFPSYSFRTINETFDVTLPLYHESE